MQQIQVTFARKSALEDDPQDQIILYWQLLETPIAQKYYKALKIATSTKYLYRRDRFINFKNSYYTESRLVEKLNKLIDSINAWYPGLIKDRAYLGMTQEFMNHIHGYFENYRGPLLNPHELYKNASTEIKEAFDELNITIHHYEDVILRKENLGLYPIIHCNFGLNEIVKRYPLEDADFDLFTFENFFGSWQISYCEVGKPLHDIWRDQDARIGEEAIHPLRYYSADGNIYLGKPVSKESAHKKLLQFYNWWDQNQEQIERFGFRKFDKKNSIGNITVANLKRDLGAAKGLNDEQIKDLISNYQWLVSVDVISD